MVENLLWLRRHMRDRMMSPAPNERLDIPPHLVAHGESGALDLVHQVADVIRGIEEHAIRTEAHCQGLVTRALDRLQAAEGRIKALETERQSLQADLRAAVEDQAKKADNALQLVEDAIRTKLLTATRRTFLKVGMAA